MTKIFPDPVARRLHDLCDVYLWPPSELMTDDDTGAPLPVFDPPLSAADESVYAELLLIASSHLEGLTLAEYRNLKPTLLDARTHRMRTDAQWTAMTAAQRDTALIAWCRDITDVLRALLKDE